MFTIPAQIKELKIKFILYNISKIILAIVIRIYYRGILQSPLAYSLL
jgi:hypothetical protein